jgi:hypothetical protein
MNRNKHKILEQLHLLFELQEKIKHSSGGPLPGIPFVSFMLIFSYWNINIKCSSLI